MAGRIRTVKPEWLEDERLMGASSAARVLSIALILLADDYGNGRAHPAYLLSQVFPCAENINIREVLAELSGWFAELYVVDGQSYFHIRNWDKHQKVAHPGKPRVPAPPAAAKVATSKSKTKVAYFARGATTGLIKIGESVDPVARLIELSTCGSEALELLVVGGSEKEHHAELQSSRVHGEWFRASHEVLAKIRELGGNPESPIFTAAYAGSRRPVAPPEVLQNPHENLVNHHEFLTPDLRSPTNDLIPTTNDVSSAQAPTDAGAHASQPPGQPEDPTDIDDVDDDEAEPGAKASPSARKPAKPDIGLLELTATERAVVDAIAADETLSPIVKRPNALARDLVKLGPGVDVVRAVHAAGSWIRADPARRKSNGNRFLNGWVKREQDNRRAPTHTVQTKSNGWAPKSVDQYGPGDEPIGSDDVPF